MKAVIYRIVMAAVLGTLCLPALAQAVCDPPTNPIKCGATGCTLEADAGFTTDAAPAVSCEVFLDGSTVAKTAPVIPGASVKCPTVNSVKPNAISCSVPLGPTPVGNHNLTARGVTKDGQRSVTAAPLAFDVTAGPPVNLASPTLSAP